MVAIPTKYRKPPWAVRQLIRETGLVEDICKHGVGHPNEDWLDERRASRPNETYWGIHGCDGCCSGLAGKAE